MTRRGGDVSDATIAVIAGGALVVIQLVVVRIMDYYFPKGWVSRRALERSVAVEVDEDEEG